MGKLRHPVRTLREKDRRGGGKPPYDPSPR
nr:MAG TPA: hypothetical protein [Bacteriophage sp.]